MPSPYPRPRPLVVAILDGWGISFVHEGNAIATAPTPNMDEFVFAYPAASIIASGAEVGLPWGEMGNSETGHRNIGAGQVTYQSLPLIDKSIADGSFFQNPQLLGAINHAKQAGSNLHLMGLVSTGGVHAHINHLLALLDLCAREGFKDRVFIHMFTDGRDTPPQTALNFLNMLEEAIGRYGVGKVASVTGRFYAMDRNDNWDRTEATYNMLVGRSRTAGAPTPREAIEQSYRDHVYDETIVPTAVTRGGDSIGPVRDHDSVIFFNFRPDRARQITRAFVHPDTVGFTVPPLEDVMFVTMSQYDRTIKTPVAFTEEPGEYPLARVLSDAGLTQFHIAETEKYAHVTYYLNVGHEEPYPGEEQVLIQSSAVKNFAMEPRMQAEQITDRVVQEIEQGLYDVYFINFANADMVGHTGNFEAALEACSCVDACLGRIKDAVFAKSGQLIVTADHGNAEEMLNPQTGEVETDHTTNQIPFYLVAAHLRRTTLKSQVEVQQILSAPIGVLADVAPTVLDILQIEKPPTMTGVSLLGSLR